MLRQYEDRTRYALPRRTYTIIRVDGQAFHTYTRPLKRPFDTEFIGAIDQVAQFLCAEIQGAQFAYSQSDEISLLLTDFDRDTTDAWFDGDLRKIVSISASLATWKFAYIMGSNRRACFDSRAFTIPDPIEVENYFIWRQRDWTRNSLQMVARCHYKQKELTGKSAADMHEMLHQKGENWAAYSPRCKNGGLTRRRQIASTSNKDVTRHTWTTAAAFPFTKARPSLKALIPQPGG
jgi:tRNA(His) 5'-end guanylyltransferase